MRQFFASADPFIARSGHDIGVFASSTVQNKLIAELSVASHRRSASGVPDSDATNRMIEDRNRKAAS
jgi:hypothetical protein